MTGISAKPCPWVGLRQSLVWFPAIPLPLGTPEHPILPDSHQISGCHLNSRLCRDLHALVTQLNVHFCIGSSTLGNNSCQVASQLELFCGMGVQSCEVHRTLNDLLEHIWAMLWNRSGVQCPAPAQGPGFVCWGQRLSCLPCAKSSLLNSGLALAALKWTCVSVLGSSMKHCNYISTLLCSLDVSNILISQHNISETWTSSL